VIYLETSDNGKTEEMLRGESTVNSVDVKSKGLLVTVNTDGTKLLPVLMERIMRAGIGIRTVNLKKPSMDDVFVHYTGRDIRDGSGEKEPESPGRR
jgi:ABC-2 type transport system ATP-binding protein